MEPREPCVVLSSARTNGTVKQRSMILIDPGATCRQLGYILTQECPFKKPNTNTSTAADAAAAAVVAMWKKKKSPTKFRWKPFQKVWANDSPIQKNDLGWNNREKWKFLGQSPL